MAEQLQQEVTAATSRVSLGGVTSVPSVGDVSEDLGLLTDSSGIQESGILTQFCLFTRMYINTWFYCIFS